jgi:hypothetical protein
MPTPPPTIFRAEALQYRLEHQQRRQTEVTFPRWMTRPAVIALWVMLALLGVATGVACLATVPVSASGLSIMMSDPAASDGNPRAAVLLPQRIEPRLRINQQAEIVPAAGNAQFDGTITEIERQPLDAAAVEQRLGLPASSMAMLEGPVVLVWVTIEPAAIEGLPPAMTGRAEFDVGTRQAGSYLPLIGQIFRSDA